MKVRNISSRLHHVGDVSIAPGEEKNIPKEWDGLYNKHELVEVKPPAPKPPGTVPGGRSGE